jgi:hypothetical protein
MMTIHYGFITITCDIKDCNEELDTDIHSKDECVLNFRGTGWVEVVEDGHKNHYCPTHTHLAKRKV